MAGEMTQSEVTREAYPLHFAVADEFGGKVIAFDQYQGPYVVIGDDLRSGSGVYALAPRGLGVVRIWLCCDDDDVVYWYNEATDTKSSIFLNYRNDKYTIADAVERESAADHREESMNDYAKLRIALQRIASGKHEDGKLMSVGEIAALATMSLLNTEDTVEEHIYLCGECPECGHACKTNDETHYVGCSRMKVTP